jgi:Helix-turn-helix domain
MTLSIFGLGTPIEYPLRERKDLISLGSPLESQVNAQYSLVKLVIDIPDRRGILTAHRRRFGMKNPVYKKIQDRNVKSRLRMLQDAQRVSGNVRQTCRFFGVSRTHFYIWKKRYEKSGLAGLRDLSRRPHRIRYRIPPEIVALILAKLLLNEFVNSFSHPTLQRNSLDLYSSLKPETPAANTPVSTTPHLFLLVFQGNSDLRRSCFLTLRTDRAQDFFFRDRA